MRNWRFKILDDKNSGWDYNTNMKTKIIALLIALPILAQADKAQAQQNSRVAPKDSDAARERIRAMEALQRKVDGEAHDFLEQKGDLARLKEGWIPTPWDNSPSAKLRRAEIAKRGVLDLGQKGSLDINSMGYTPLKSDTSFAAQRQRDIQNIPINTSQSGPTAFEQRLALAAKEAALRQDEENARQIDARRRKALVELAARQAAQQQAAQQAASNPIRVNAYGLGVNADASGASHVYRTKSGESVSTTQDGVKRDAYGTGIHADQYGRAVYDSKP